VGEAGSMLILFGSIAALLVIVSGVAVRVARSAEIEPNRINMEPASPT